MSFITEHQARINQRLSCTLQPDYSLANPMNYSLLAPSKRLRPLIIYATGQSFNLNSETLDSIAVSVEALHTYSLIHDDLPAMDNDDLRRGQPSAHKAFTEAQAILAGDSLQTIAFESLSNTKLPPAIVLEMINVLTNASGYRGMAEGQALDIAAEGQTITLVQLEKIHALKTGKLIQACFILAGLAAQVPLEKLQILAKMGKAFGIAFQIQDDILDITETTATLGKPAGSDLRQQKATYPSILGLIESQARLQAQLNTVFDLIKQLTLSANHLTELTQWCFKC